jgi:hypothetical protein
METRYQNPPQSLVEALSKPGRAKAVGALVDWANSGVDQTLTQRSLRLMRACIHAVKSALPDKDPELIGGFFANLLDIWETGQRLDTLLKDLAKSRLPRDEERLRNTLLWIDAIQVDMASYWIREIKRDLPKVLKALDISEYKRRLGKPKRSRSHAVTK